MSIKNLRNYLLISTPELNDSIFRKSIILLCEHDENGAMGLILNKPIISDDNCMDSGLLILLIVLYLLK